MIPFRRDTERVEAIIILRAFPVRNRLPIRYQFLEILTRTFNPTQELTVSVFKAHSPTVDCHQDGEVVACVALDRSDVKITVNSILLSNYTVHAEWQTNRWEFFARPSGQMLGSRHERPRLSCPPRAKCTCILG